MKCAVHTEVDATGFCRNCGKALCAACQRDVRGALYCEDCIATALTGENAAHTKSDANPGAAAALGLIPGLGAVYNGEYTKAIIHVAVWGGLFAIGLTSALGDLTPLVWIAFGLVPVYMSLDAYRVARGHRSGTIEPGDAAPSSRPMGAFVLIGLGVLALLGNFGLIRGEWIERGWPIILIGIGAWLLVKRTRG
jgi:Domain of unknown function (DUF5668)